ncbi:MAG: PASTA domain-containing protein [Gaiellaceae bacterium]
MSPLFRRRPREEYVEETETLPPVDERVVTEEEVVEQPPRRPPTLWPYLLVLLLLVLGGLGAFYYFAREEDKETVPAVVDLTVDEATERLTNAGFRTVVERQENGGEPGRVFAQRPGGGSQLESGEAVTVLVSAGEAETTVPNVVGLPEDDAVARLDGASLGQRRRGVFSEEPPGVVVAQSPAAGEEAPVGTKVRINISKGTGRVKVPSVLGRKSDDAGAIIREAGLQARAFDVPSAEPKGTVVAQSPQPGSELARGEFVRINVSTGEGGEDGREPRPIAVPDLRGRPLTEAQDELQAAGFVVRVDFVPSREPEATVVSQSPRAGAKAHRGSSIRINVSEGPNPQPRQEIPDVVGLDEQEATTELEDAGFEVRVLSEPTPDESEVGLVLRQEPAAGRSAPRGALITIYVAELA